MDVLTEKYRKLNPFIDHAVGENVIWGSHANDFCDVESINEPAFKRVISDLEAVNDDGKTRARFLVGIAGSGKSHLFARLRRRLTNGQFTFVSNPPNAIPHIKRFILKKIVSGMTKPVMGPHGPLPYTQLQRMVYSLLQRFLREKNWNIDQIHERWEKLSPSRCSQNMKNLEKALAKSPELTTLIHVSRVLVRILDKAKCHLAASWLSGNQHLSEADLYCLGVPGPLGDDEISELMKQLGHLSFGAGPTVLILDQLELLVQPDQIREIESLMIDLNDSSCNWYVIISLVHETFDIWISTLSMPFQQRFGTVTHDSVSLAIAELSGLSEEQRRELIRARLLTPALVSQRKNDGIDDPYFPLSESEIQELTCSDISNARMLIQQAKQTYVAAVSGSTPVAKTTLFDFIEERFADLRAELQGEDLSVDTASVADRVDELFGLLWSSGTNCALKGTDGELHRDLPNFEGVDRVYSCGDKTVRVVLYDVQQTNKFPSVLNRIVGSLPATILVRDGRVSISGRATKEKLDLFRKDKKFFHLCLDDIKNLHALGTLLARMREGEFVNQDTEPRPTDRGIYECLAQHRDLVETDLAQAFMAMAGLSTPPGGVDTPKPEPDSFEPDDPIVEGLTRIMKEERWMSFERLCVRAGSKGITADPQRVSVRLKARPICESVLIYPRNANLLESIAIVIWNLEE